VRGEATIMPPQLVALTEGPSILLDKPILLLGRHQECDIQLGSRKVSRRHCCLAQVDDYLVVRDLGSTNGIRINGVRVLEGSLQAGDELTIGNQRYQVQWSEKAGDPLASSTPPAADKRQQTAPEDDARLESSESPVPLRESVLLPQMRPAVLTGRPAPAAPQAPAISFDAVLEPPAILPDEIELKPLSGEERPPVNK
jgi:pSer/pThr/pTyr-binding forkhead associated (FHA) protein